MSDHPIPPGGSPPDLTSVEVRNQFHGGVPLRGCRQQSQVVTAAVADEMGYLGLDARFASRLAERAMGALRHLQVGAGDEDAEFAVNLSGYPLESQDTAVDVVDDILEILLQRPRLLGVIGFTSGRNSPGVTFTVKAPEAWAAIRVGLEEVEDALSRLGVGGGVAKVEAEPAEWFWNE